MNLLVLCFRIMDLNDEVTRKRAIRLLAIIVVVIIVVAILGFVFNIILPSLIGTVIVILVVAFVAHRIYVKKSRSVSMFLLSKLDLINCMAKHRSHDKT